MLLRFAWLVLFAGNGLALVALGIVMFRHRRISRSFQFLAALFFSSSLFLLIGLAAGLSFPGPVRPLGYRRMVLFGQAVLAAGVWPATLHLVFGQWLNGHKSLVQQVSNAPEGK